MWRSLLYAVLIVLGMLVYSYRDSLQRNVLGGWDSGKPTQYHIGVVYPASQADADLLIGAQIAAEDINAEGGLLGRSVVLVPVQEQAGRDLRGERGTIDEALEIARRLSRDLALIGVLGHSSSTSAVTASPIYDQANKLFLSPYATSAALVRHKLDRLFAMQPSNAGLAYVLAEHARKQGLKRLVLLSDDSEYGRETALYFAIYAQEFGVDIVFRNAFRPIRKSIEDILTFMLDNTAFSMDTVDGIVAIAGPQQTGTFIRIARRLGIVVPILGTDAISDPETVTVADGAMRDVVGVTVVDPAILQRDGAAFAAKFAQRRGRTPSLWGVLGHDAVRLIVESGRRIDKIDATAMADLLRVMRFEDPIVGANGPYRFGQLGEILGKPVFVIRHDGKAFDYVGRYDVLPRIGDNEGMRFFEPLAPVGLAPPKGTP